MRAVREGQSTSDCFLRMNTISLPLPSAALPGASLAEPLRAWYCLRVESRREHIAALNLTRRTGLAIFAPRIRLRKSVRGRAAGPALEALFPGYIFARFRYPHEARHVASTPGVLGLVSFGAPPPAVHDEVINYLATEVKKADSTPLGPTFEEGDWVRIAAGCFRGSEGRVVQSGTASPRICVLMKLLGQDVQISVPADHLTGVTDTSTRSGLPAGLRHGPPSTSPARP